MAVPGSSASVPTLAPLEGDTVHFKLSSHDLHAPLQDDDELRSESGKSLSSHSSGSAHPRLTTYRGPECYVRPQTKSNRKIIKNAICYVCLAGEANLSIRQRALAVSESLSHMVTTTVCIWLFGSHAGVGGYQCCPCVHSITRCCWVQI